METRSKTRSHQQSESNAVGPEDSTSQVSAPSSIQSRRLDLIRQRAKLKAQLSEMETRSQTQVKSSQTRSRQQSESNAVGPEDSASQVSALSSTSIQSRRLDLIRQRAELKAQLSLIKDIQGLEAEELKVRQRRAEIDSKVKLVALEEEDKLLTTATGFTQDPPTAGIPPVIVDDEVLLNVNAAEFTPVYSEANNNATNDSVADNVKVSHDNVNYDLVNAIRLPSAQLITFDGDPLKFWTFIRAFEHAVESCTGDNAARLMRLMTYCTGKARKVIECCAIMNPEEGYSKAKALLKHRFGNDFLIAEAWIKKVTSVKPIGPQEKERLQDLADDLHSCIETLATMNYTSELSNQATLLKVAEQLPAYLQARVKRELCKGREEGQVPDIKFLARLIREAANEANDPVFGKLAVRSDRSQAAPVTQMRATSHRQSTLVATTAVTAPQSRHQSSDNSERQQHKSCVMCGEFHTLFGCQRFKSLSVNERIAFVKQKGLCFNCLLPNHQSSNCPLTRRCSVNGCGKRHTKFLHVVNRETTAPRQEQSTNQSSQVPAATGVTSVSTRLTGAGVSKNALPIVPVVARNPVTMVEVQTYALLDSGSTNSFCSPEIMQQLNLCGTAETLNLTTLNVDHKSVEATVVGLELCNVNKSVVIEIPEVFVTESVPVNVTNKAEPEEVKVWPHLVDIQLPEVDSNKVGLLIGQNCPGAIVPLEIRRGEPDSPYAVRTVFGWTVNGPVGRLPGKCRAAFANFVQSNSTLEGQIERLWMLDTVPEPVTSLSVNDRKALDIWNESIQQQCDGHYELAIPFKNRPPRLPDNLELATQRLNSLKRKLLRDPELHVKYTAYMSDLLAKGYAEEATSTPDNGNVWYLPHHSVNNVNKPEKVRIVFDCSAKYSGTSLNENVFQGPDMMNKLIGVLLRFREEPVAFMADIEAMFHQVNVSAEDREFLRFLWWPNGHLNMQPHTYRMTVHLFGGVWSPSCCNYVLRRAAEERKTAYSEEVIDTVLRNFYVDDCLKSVASEDKAISLIQGLRSILQESGFHLTKWMSNSETVMSTISESDRSTSSFVNLQKGDILTERALGVRWEPECDLIGFTSVTKDKPLSRRGILSIVNSVYDPLGLISPFILPAKRIIQELCRKGIGWDDTLPENELEAWQFWQRDQQKLNLLKVNRCIRPSSAVATTQVHHFSDASQYAYGVASYVRSVDTDGQISCHLLMSRSRLAPLKTLTIPRLELAAATLAVKIDKLIRKEIEVTVDSSFFWTDSTIVLRYIYSDDKRFHTFVANRVAIIRENSTPKQWRHIDSQLNPADDASRGLNADQLINSDRWFIGPHFLRDKEDEWPVDRLDDATTLENDPEVKQDNIVYATSVSDSTNQDDVFNRLFSHYSDWMRLKITVAWLLRTRICLRDKARGENPSMSRQPVSVLELADSEVQILKIVQQRSFSKEFDTINELSLAEVKSQNRGRANAVTMSSRLYRLEPIKLDDGLLRVGGRLQCHQVILPNDHAVVSLIVRHFHVISCHSGREHVLSLLRQHYWVIKGRLVVRRVLSDCMFCKRLFAKTLAQRMADLPCDRVTPGEPPFTYTGVDLFGPFLVKRGRCEVKRYGCLFTCLVIRAIHIEVLHSLETDSFLQALQRFISRRGQVKLIRSDNGTNFVGAAGELCQVTMNQVNIEKYLHHRGIQWCFNPPSASHMGGVWERMIRSVRKILTVLLREQTLDDERLVTFMCIAESTVNSRPITTVSDDPRDHEALTPNHLLLLRGNANLPVETSQRDLYSRKRWRQVQYLADVFWRRWTREYLPTLQLRQKWHEPVKNLKVGDTVILPDDKLPRNSWPLGRVVETYPGSDGLVRSVKITTKSASAPATLVRPVHKLCLLESVNT